MQNQRVTTKVPTDNRLSDAARWYAKNCQNSTRAFVPLLRQKFGLTALQAIQAAQLARGLR